MNTTNNLKLNTVGKDEDLLISDLVEKLAGSGANSNMEILDAESAKYMKSSDYDGSGSVKTAGGIEKYISSAIQAAPAVFITTMTYVNSFACDKTFAEIVEAYGDRKTCILYADVGERTGNNSVFTLALKDATQVVFTAISNEKLYQFSISSDNTITFAETNIGKISNISDAVDSDSAITAASSKAVKTAYDLANSVKNSLSDYIPESTRGANNGVASLDENGKVPSNQLDLSDSITSTDNSKIASSKAVKTVNDKIPTLSSAINSSSTTQAANSAAVKTAYDKANDAYTKANDAYNKQVTPSVSIIYPDCSPQDGLGEQCAIDDAYVIGDTNRGLVFVSGRYIRPEKDVGSIFTVTGLPIGIQSKVYFYPFGSGVYEDHLYALYDIDNRRFTFFPLASARGTYYFSFVYVL